MKRWSFAKKLRHLGVVASVLAALVSPLVVAAPAQAATIGSVTNQPQDTGGGGSTSDPNCGSGQILQRITSNWDSGYPAITSTYGTCYSLNSDGLSTSSSGTNTGSGGSGSGNISGYTVDCTAGRDRTWAMVGARVYLEGSNSYASGVQVYCAKLAGGSSSTRVFDGGWLGRTSSSSYQDIYCSAGTVAVGMHLRVGGITDAFGLNCAPISGAVQSITFGALSNRAYSAGALSLSGAATTTSTSSVTFSSSTTGVCTVSGTTVTLVTPGTCSITANAASDTNYAAATQVTQSFTVTQGTQAAITLTSTSALVGTPQTMTATGGSGTGAFSFAVTSAGTANCSISGTSLTATATGTCTVTATRAADTNYLAGSSSATTVTVTAGTALTPVFGSVSFSNGKWSIPVTNYDAAWNWTTSATNSATVTSVVSGSTITYTVTPTAGASSALTVNTARTSYNNGTATSTAYYPVSYTHLRAHETG
jgi:hypothetical protein